MHGKGTTIQREVKTVDGVNPERGWLGCKKQYQYLENERQEEKRGEDSIRRRESELDWRRARKRRGRIK